jgi:hypothetical protein
MRERLKAYLGLGPAVEPSAEVSRSKSIVIGVVFFVLWVPLFAGLSAFGTDDRSFVESLPSAAVVGIVAAVGFAVWFSRYLRSAGRS